MQRLATQLTEQLADMQGQRDTAHEEQKTLVRKLDVSQEALTAAQRLAAKERTEIESAHRTAEDRWMREVDRSRQEETRLATHLQQVERAAEAGRQKAATEINDLSARLRKAERDEAAKAARLAALEGQLDRLHSQLKERLKPVAKRTATSTAKKIAQPRLPARR